MTTNIIFVLSQGRTGSTLLCQLLTLYQRTINLNEALMDTGQYDLFGTLGISKYLKNKYDDLSLSNSQLHDKLISNPIDLIKDISNGCSDNETLIVKLHLSQTQIFTNKENLDWILSQPNHKFIILERTNFLKTYVSQQISIQTNKWHNVDNTDIKVKIDPVDLSNKLHAYRARYYNIKKALMDHNIDYLVMEYDRDLKKYNIGDFVNLVDPWVKRNSLDLKLSNSPVVQVKRQNNNENIFDNITNIDEVEELIKNNYFILDSNYQPKST